MSDVIHENNLINVSAATAKEKKKKSKQYLLYFFMASAAFLCPTAFGVYFAIEANSVGVWSYFVTAFVALCIAVTVFVVVIPKYRDCRQAVSNFKKSGGELKKTPPVDAFCMGFVQILFVAMTALLACFVPTLITKCRGMSFSSTFKYAFYSLGSFWGMDVGDRDFFSFIVGLGLMALIFALVLLIAKFVSKLLK